MITSIWLIGGLQLIALGFIGEYIGKIYKETKSRPKFVVDIDTYNLAVPEEESFAPEEGELLIDYNPLSETN